jgi:uncharacterized protein (TIGR02118 family)
MLKLIWFLKRADNLMAEQFNKWWVETHAPAIADAQKPYLKKYVINSRLTDDQLPAKPNDDVDWDGCAELWYDSEADYRAIYQGQTAPSAIRTDALKHTSRLARIIVRENQIKLRNI